MQTYYQSQYRNLVIFMLWYFNLAHHVGYGRASTERLMTPWALVRIGSISKVITAVAVMKLVEQRQLRLQSTVFGHNGQFVSSTVR